MSKAERTRLRLQECALVAFERDGFDNTTVADIAHAAGVSQMTFFRYFSTKERAVVWDPYDPAIARAIREQPAAVSALCAACRGIRQAWDAVDSAAESTVRRRARLVAANPALRAAMWAAHTDTEAAIASALRERYGQWESAAAAGACLGALTTVLLSWATDADAATTLTEAIDQALSSLDTEGHNDHNGL